MIQHLRSAASHQLVVPSYRLSSYGRRAFSVVGPTMWNSLPIQLLDLFTPPPSLVVYWRHFFSQSTSVYSALGADFSALMRYINSRFTYFSYCGSLA